MPVDGLMMDYQLVLPAILERAQTFFGHKEVVSRRPDRSLHRYTYADMALRTRQLAVALEKLGIQRGDRVATLAWNHYRHLEAYFAIPSMGAVLHTLNLRLPPEDLAYIINHSGDRVVLVDDSLVPLLSRVRDLVSLDHVIVMTDNDTAPEGCLHYDQLLADVGDQAASWNAPELNEHEAAAMCYTSGTTGRPKGVLYSHRALVLHSLAATMADGLGIYERDVVCPVVPMFHVNAWGFPFTSTMVGATQIMPGPYLDPASLLDLFASQRVTLTAGVPTIWLGILQTLDKDPKAYDLSAMRGMIVGGQAAPRSMIESFEKRHGLNVVHAWGMTETTPLGTIATLSSEMLDASEAEQYAVRATQGRPAAFVEVRARGENGLVPWDGKTMGELEVRGPWVAAAYYNQDDTSNFTEDGWFRTGDIVTIDHRGYVTITDREKDVIKSGGEWISSVALENALMAHPAVAEAAVFAVPHPKWIERPMGVVVLKEGVMAEIDDLKHQLETQFVRYWVPDRIDIVDEIPKTATGKFLKSALRERYHDAYAKA